jgi:hypothetical protein
MAIPKGKADAGLGGKLGHSNQDHWDFTEAIKDAARKQRRLDAKKEIRKELRNYHDGGSRDLDRPDVKK